MRSLGILSVREETGRKNKIRLVERERFSTNLSVVVAELVTSRRKLEKMKPWRLRRWHRKGVSFLQKLGVEAVVPTVTFGRWFHLPVTAVSQVECAIRPEEMEEALQAVLSQDRESPKGRTGWVIDRNCSKICYRLLSRLCNKVQYLGLVTEDIARAEALEERLCHEYGVNLEICSNYPWKEGRDTILVDVEKGRVALDGRTVLNSKQMTLDLHGYHIDLAALFRQHPELYKQMTHQGWCIRKSG